MSRILDILIGRSLSNQEEHSQQIGPLAGIPVLGLDALSSSAYGPEAAATVLIPLGAAGATQVLPIIGAIIVLLTIVYFSYRQTISEYPNGGGSYTVACENLGTSFGLLAAAALMLDYILVVAVGISAGVGALISAVPQLQSHILSLCLITLTIITFVNLRGLKESGAAFMLPTYLFVISMIGVLGYGVVHSLLTNGHPIAVVTTTHSLTQSSEVLSLWIILRAFSSGCTAMTGVEAVSNGVKAFREPVVKHAQMTLTLIISLLVILLAGIAYLAQTYQITATDPGAPGYESMISMLIAAVVGRGIVYYVTIASVIGVLLLSANTGFADFPRLCQILARDNYLPHIFAERGRRLVFSYGIIAIALAAALLLVLFGGITDHLIPLFAIGAFLAFTLSQIGMVVHWFKLKDIKRHAGSIAVNGLGALATGITLSVVMVSKFAEGGWLTLVSLPILMAFFYWARRHYVRMAQTLRTRDTIDYSQTHTPLVIVPVRGWSKINLKAMQFALNISDEIYGVHVDSGDGCKYVEEQWHNFVTGPADQAKKKPPTLISLQSPYRRLFGSLMDFITDLEKKHPHRQIAILIPTLVKARWYHYFLHNQRALLLQASLHLRADHRIIIITVPWYL